MLHWILVCSCLFQGARYLAYVEHDNFEEGVLFQYDPSSGPDFWRWVEYAVTSPLQIILIAGSFYMREIVLMATMAGLQGALVLLGYVIELEIHALCLEKIAAWQAGAYRPQGKTTVKMFVGQCKLFFLSVCRIHLSWHHLGGIDYKISDASGSHCRLSKSKVNATRSCHCYRAAVHFIFDVWCSLDSAGGNNFACAHARPATIAIHLANSIVVLFTVEHFRKTCLRVGVYCATRNDECIVNALEHMPMISIQDFILQCSH